MTEVQVIFEEAIENGLLGDVVTIVRRDGQIFDFVLPGEVIMAYDILSEERLEDVMRELGIKKDHLL